MLCGHGDCSGRNRCDVAANAGFGSSALSDFEGMAEKQIELRPSSVFGLRNVPSPANLSENFGFAYDGRVDARCNAEEMSGSSIGIVNVKVTGKFFWIGEGEFREERPQVAVGGVKLFSDDVDLGAIACRQHHGFTHMVL